MAMTDGLLLATASTRRAIVSRGHGHDPRLSSERRSMSTTRTGGPAGFRSGVDPRICGSAASTMSNALSRNTFRQSPGISAIAARNSTSARIPAIRTGCVLPNRLSMRAVNFRQPVRTAEDAIERPADRPDLLQPAERLVDLWTAGAEQQGKFALRHSKIQRQAVPPGRLVTSRV